jgi:hypothetical protein
MITPLDSQHTGKAPENTAVFLLGTIRGADKRGSLYGRGLPSNHLWWYLLLAWLQFLKFKLTERKDKTKGSS